MIYNSKDGEIDLSKITRLYPAAVIKMYGEVAEMSLEWMEDYGSKVELLYYALVFDFTLPKEEKKNKKVLTFETKELLLEAMQDVAKLFEK
jgi:hypothetical protein